MLVCATVFVSISMCVDTGIHMSCMPQVRKSADRLLGRSSYSTLFEMGFLHYFHYVGNKMEALTLVQGAALSHMDPSHQSQTKLYPGSELVLMLLKK